MSDWQAEQAENQRRADADRAIQQQRDAATRAENQRRADADRAIQQQRDAANRANGG